MKYKYILIIYRWWNKSGGWTRWAVRLTSTETGKQLKSIIPHPSNFTAALSNVLGSMDSVYYMTMPAMSKKDFANATADFDGECMSGDLEKKIRETFKD